MAPSAPQPPAFEPRFDQPVPVPDWWTSRVDQIHALVAGLRRAERSELGTSPGGQGVTTLAYGPASPCRGTANKNSALAALRPEAFCDRAQRERPVLMVLAGIHGAEVEGMMGACSLLCILDEGVDLRGRPQPALREQLERLRVVVVPLLNPDGRRRNPYPGWVGLPREEMTRVNQGTHRDGSLWGWPDCKALHPMTGEEVGGLGAYFDDAGTNLMHDEWSAPTSPLTAPLLDLVRREAPDVLLNLHSYAAPPGMLRTAYVPRSMKLALAELAETFRARMAELGLETNQVPPATEDGEPGSCPPALNLASICYHVGAELSVLFESPHGFADAARFDYDQLLDLHHVLFELAAERLV